MGPIFDGFDFVANGIVFKDVDHMTIARRENQIEDRANRQGGVLVQSRLGTKPIYLEGYYIGTSIIDAQTMYDVLAQALNRQSRLLQIPHAGGMRRYIATPENVIIKEPDGLNRLTFNFEFVIPDGSSEAASLTTLIDAVITAASTTIPLNVLGSVIARPLITLTYSGVTGGTGKIAAIRNARDFVGLTFSRNFADGDVLTIDSDKFQIYLNGVLTQPDGRMPTWPAGTGSLFYSDTLTTRSVHITATYLERSL